MARILITGATGFLGGHLARHLHARGDAVVGVGRSHKKLKSLEHEGIQVVSIDLANTVSAHVYNQIGAVDAVVHCAAFSSAWGPKARFISANVTGTSTAIQLAKNIGARRFVNISSPTVYFANQDQTGIRENHSLARPINTYAETKAMAEQIVLNDPEIDAINLRPRGIYGAGDTTLLPRLLAAAQSGPLPLLRGGVADIDLTHVSDVVGAICAALHAGPAAVGQTFNISGGQPQRVTQIVENVCAASGVPVRWKALPWRATMAAAGVSEIIARARQSQIEPRLTRYKVGLFAFRQSLDISKSKLLLGWAPQVDFDEGLARTLKQRPGP